MRESGYRRNEMKEHSKVIMTALVLCVVFSLNSRKAITSGQPPRVDQLHTPAEGSGERKAIIDAVREEYKEGADHPAKFKVNYLKVHQGWAWINVTPLDAKGQPVAD